MISLQLVRNAGLASLLTSLCSHIYRFENDIDAHFYARSTVYSQEGENMFDCFFEQCPLKEPIEIWRHGPDETAANASLPVIAPHMTPIILEGCDGHDFHAYPPNRHLAQEPERLERLRSMAARYFLPKQELIEIARRTVGHGPVFGIHYRGTDKKVEVPRVPPEQVLAIFQRRNHDGPVFLATDEQAAAQFFKAHIPRIVINDHLRSYDDRGVHFSRGGRQQAMETMVDIYCLAMCESLLIGRGNCGDMALVLGATQAVEYFN